MDLEQSEQILSLIEKISPYGRDYVNIAIQNSEVEVLFYSMEEKNKGVFLKAENDESCIFYASFLDDCNIDKVLELIKCEIIRFISKTNIKELCFNVYGNNERIILLVRSLGFKSDMEGYHLQYTSEDIPRINTSNLIIKEFEDSMLSKFIQLFDRAYYKLNEENGWMVNSYKVYAEQFRKRLNSLNELGQVSSFWIGDELIGAYIFEDNYITDIVVNPAFQNKGYGSYLLEHCIINMKNNKSIKNIRLRVAKSNISAKRLYERNNFTEIACFAEHTYEEKL